LFCFYISLLAPQHLLLSLLTDAGSVSAHTLAQAELERVYDAVFACAASLIQDIPRVHAAVVDNTSHSPLVPPHAASSANSTIPLAASASASASAAANSAAAVANGPGNSSASFGAYVHPGKANVSRSSPGSWRFALHNLLARPQDFKPQVYYEVQKRKMSGKKMMFLQAEDTVSRVHHGATLLEIISLMSLGTLRWF